MKNSDCHKAEELILTDLDEGLLPDKRVVLERHLSECAGCRKTWDETRLLLSQIAAVAPKDPGEAFWKNYQISLEARLCERDNSVSWGLGFWWKATGAFALAALVFVVVSVGVIQHNAVRPPTDESTVSTNLISDLDQLYGPLLAEVATHDLDFDTEDSHLTNSMLAFSDDLFEGWFEEEDEPNQLFL